MFEELFYDASSAHPTRHPKILRASLRGPSHEVPEALEALEAAIKRQDEGAARAELFARIAAPVIALEGRGEVSAPVAAAPSTRLSSNG
jgi:FlaA1/EpsC-like NDP-sugar epimerase